MTDVPDWTQSVNIQNAEIPVAGGVTIDAGQSGVGVFVGSLEYPQQVNSSYRLSETVAVYTETVPLFTLTTSIGVVVYPAIPPNFAVGTTVTVSVVGGITGVVYADEVQLQYGEGAQVTVAISGALEVTAVVTVTYSTPSLMSGDLCFFIGTFGPAGALVVPDLPAPPTAGWVNVQPVPAAVLPANILDGFLSGSGTLLTIPAGRQWQGAITIAGYPNGASQNATVVTAGSGVIPAAGAQVAGLPMTTSQWGSQTFPGIIVQAPAYNAVTLVATIGYPCNMIAIGVLI